MKLLIVAQNLQIGGVQTALINMLRELVNDENLQVDLFIFGEGSFIHEIPDKVRVIKGSLLLRLVATPLSEVRRSNNWGHLLLRVMAMLVVRLLGSHHFYRRLFRLQKEVERYDVAISYFNDVPHNFFNQGTNQFVDEFVGAGKKLAWIHTDPIQAGFERDTCLKTYKNFDGIVCVSKACKVLVDQLLPEYQHKTFVVNNFFSVGDLQRKASEFIPFEPDGRINIITVGRVDNFSKRMDRIPKVCKLLKEDAIDNFRWRIVGDGPDLEKNKQLALQYGVLDKIEFLEYKSNPYPYIKSSDLLVLTSAFEGYPMVIGEALILETPVVSTHYAAAEEQIMQGVNGIIVDVSTTKLYEGLRRLLLNSGDIGKLADNLRDIDGTNKSAALQLMSILATLRQP